MSDTNQNIANRTFSQDSSEQIEAAAASMNSFPVGIHAITTAYSDYSKKSFEDARLFVEKLSGVKSVDKAIQLQTEYAKSAFETFMATRRRLACCIAILLCSPINHSVVFLPRRTRKPINLPSRYQRKMPCSSRGLFCSREPLHPPVHEEDSMSHANPPFHNLSLNPGI